MLFECRFLVEPFATKAGERLGPAVREAVPVELGLAVEPPGALPTEVIAAPCEIWIKQRPLLATALKHLRSAWRDRLGLEGSGSRRGCGHTPGGTGAPSRGWVTGLTRVSAAHL